MKADRALQYIVFAFWNIQILEGCVVLGVVCGFFFWCYHFIFHINF